MKILRLSKDLSLPLDAVTQTFAILAMRGVGKTHTASVFAEEMSEAGLPFVVLDPTGAWWGLRAGADGKGPGYPVTILGGDHGDVPLEEGAGKLIADLVAEKAPSLILDLSLLSKSAMRRFVADFAEELYRKNRQPLHLLIDEADSFAPQKPQPDEMRMLGALDEIVRRGRIRGLGCTLVTQRSAVLNKDVLTQTETLVVLRTAHPRDRAPVLEWMKVHATSEQLAAVEESLAKLPKGDAWVMSAGWLDLFARVHIRERKTFNSSATPEPGQVRATPRQLAPVDLEELQVRMAETIERAKASDPALLRRRVAELERELVRKLTAASSAPAKIERVEVPVIGDVQVARLAKAVERMGDVAEKLAGLAAALREGAGEIVAGVKRFQAPAAPRQAAPIPPARRIVPAPASRRADGPRPEANGAPSPYALGLIQTLAQRHPMRVTRGQLAVLSGRSGRSSAFSAAAAEVLRAGLVRQEGALLSLTEEGVTAVGGVAAAPASPQEVQETWRRALPDYERGLLEVLLAAHPGALTREELAQRAEKSITSSAFSAAVASLRKNGLVDLAGGEVRASETLFLG